MVLVSVIIPVYNAALYLPFCLASLLEQTLPSCEFIFINDGSTDGSAVLLDAATLRDARIVVLHQDNQGVSAARNRGLAVAKGTYIGFVDADDTVVPTYFETLVGTAQAFDLDVTICNYFSSQDGHAFVSTAPFPTERVLDAVFIQQHLVPHFIGYESLNAIWNKLYKKELLDHHQLLFPVGVALGEDGLFNLHVFSKSTSVYFLDYAGYHYQEVAGSATRDFKSKNYLVRLEEEFHYDYGFLVTPELPLATITYLKAQKYVRKSLSLLHAYYHPQYQLTKKETKVLVNVLLNSKTTRNVLHTYYKILFLQKTNYEKGLLLGLRYRIPFLIRYLIAYSAFRNKK